jgi:hypothetical protein
MHKLEPIEFPHWKLGIDLLPPIGFTVVMRRTWVRPDNLNVLFGPGTWREDPCTPPSANGARKVTITPTEPEHA